ncbi:hypothetical protein [Cohnella yongneupensis]|uniref:Uncharacterized protein n=1 Tax=Cohnella yongneupensis TaxID=425006 RepID=A0ABW0R5E8_9BACL
MDKVIPSVRYSLIGLEVDGTTLAELLEMARRHCRLILEHSKPQTTVGGGKSAKKLRAYDLKGNR